MWERVKSMASVGWVLLALVAAAGVALFIVSRRSEVIAQATPSQAPAPLASDDSVRIEVVGKVYLRRGKAGTEEDAYEVLANKRKYTVVVRDKSAQKAIQDAVLSHDHDAWERTRLRASGTLDERGLLVAESATLAGNVQPSAQPKRDAAAAPPAQKAQKEERVTGTLEQDGRELLIRVSGQPHLLRFSTGADAGEALALKTNLWEQAGSEVSLWGFFAGPERVFCVRTKQ